MSGSCYSNERNGDGECNNDRGGCVNIMVKTVMKDGEKWVWKYVSTAADGTVSEVTNTVIIEDEGATHVHVGTNRVRGGESLPDYRDVWKRVNK